MSLAFPRDLFRAEAPAAFALIDEQRFEDAAEDARLRLDKQRAGAADVALVIALDSARRRSEALEAARDAAQRSSTDPRVADAIGTLLAGMDDYGAARRAFRDALGRHPGHAPLWYNLASVERALGNLGEAEAACDAAILHAPDDFLAYLLRSDLRTQTAADNHVGEIEARLAGALPESGRLVLLYALGKELDDLGEYPRAFAAFAAGAAIRRRQLTYDVGRDIAKFERIRTCYGAATLARTSSFAQSARFGFVVGLPRSGTTLVERILSARSDVASNEETQNFAKALLDPRAAPELSPPGDVFARAAAADMDFVAARYAELAGGAGQRLTIDKLPMNYLYLGPIHMALPQAPIILLRRSAMDSCFAMFRVLFGSAYPFSYDFDDLAAYYAAWHRLMEHWRSHLPDGRLCELRYEDLVSDAEETGARLTAYCGLEWQPEQMRFHEARRHSTTASAAQVRRPVYSSSVGRWRRYAEQLAPLERALKAHGIEVD